MPYIPVAVILCLLPPAFALNISVESLTILTLLFVPDEVLPK